MKIIDLLNKIANGEEVPKKIIFDKFCKYEYELLNNDMGYCRDDGERKFIRISTDFELTDALNEEVEIIEEDKPIKEINEHKAMKEIFNYENGSNLYFLSLFTLHTIIPKINELIDEINKLKEK